MNRITVKKDGDNLTFRVGGGVRKGHRMSLHIGTMQLKLDPQYADMTMREIAKGIVEHFGFKRGELEFLSVELCKREETPR